MFIFLFKTIIYYYYIISYLIIKNVLPNIIYINSDNVFDFYIVKTTNGKKFIKVAMLKGVFDWRVIYLTLDAYAKNKILLCISENEKDITNDFLALYYYYIFDNKFIIKYLENKNYLNLCIMINEDL